MSNVDAIITMTFKLNNLCDDGDMTDDNAVAFAKELILNGDIEIMDGISITDVKLIKGGE